MNIDDFLIPLNTPEGQRKAISTLDKIITVGAGAGTGKTWVLSGRYVKLLLSGLNLNEKTLPGDILTLTYTETAAGDMRRRIEARIQDTLSNVKNAERIREINDGLGDAWISTIHSFATRLIRECGLSLDIDPGASVISTQQEEDFWDGIKNAVAFADLKSLADAYSGRTKILKDTARQLDKDKLMNAAVSKWGPGSLSSLAREVCELHASSGNTWEQMMAWPENDLLIDEARDSVENILKREWQKVWDEWQAVDDLPDPTNPNGPGGLLKSLLQSRNQGNTREFYSGIVLDKRIRAGNYEPFKTLKSILGMTLGVWREKQNELIARITPDYDKDFLEQELALRKSLLKFCAVSWGMWDSMKRRRGLLSFSDMIIHARRAIEEGGVKRIFHHILVDEFQDTDPLQFKMIEALAERSDKTSLFAVGDPKQSIYGFRHAEPSLFADTIKKAGTRVDLDVSFRTRTPLLNRINKLFASIWKDGLGSSEAMSSLRFKPLSPANSYGTDDTDKTLERDAGTMPDFRIFLKNRQGSREQALEELAGELADNIASWVNEEQTVWDKDEKKLRPVRFSDFAVLLRNRNNHDMLERVFASRKIKSIQDHSKGWFNRGEVSDVICMLKAASDFEDHAAVLGWLMSPFSEVNERDALKCLRLVGLPKDAKIKNRPIEIIKNSLPEAYSRLKFLSLTGESEGPAKLLSIFDKDRRWLSCYRPEHRLRVIRNVRRAISIAGKFQESGTSSLSACAEWLARAIRSGVVMDEPAWHDKNENAVLLSTIHAAKGLEYPIAVIFDAKTQKTSGISQLKASKSLGLVFTSLPDEMTCDAKEQEKILPRGSDWENLLSSQSDLEEDMRLFYVAATRAQDSLIFCGLVREKDNEPFKNTWGEVLYKHASEDWPDVQDTNFKSDSEINRLKQDNDYNNEHKPLKAIPTVKIKNSLRQISASSFAMFEWCPVAWRRRYRQGFDIRWGWESSGYEEQNDNRNDENEVYEGYGGAEAGSLAHWILARWPTGRNNENLEIELDRYLHDRETLEHLPIYLRSAWRDESAKKSLRVWLANFARSKTGTEIISRLRDRSLRREAKFRLKLDRTDKNSCSIILVGAVDALWHDEDAYHILDYKITLSDNAPPGLYESQLDFYALAIHLSIGETKQEVSTGIAFLRENNYVERKYCGGWDELKERVFEAAEAGAAGNYVAKLENCTLCPYQKGCYEKKINKK